MLMFGLIIFALGVGGLVVLKLQPTAPSADTNIHLIAFIIGAGLISYWFKANVAMPLRKLSEKLAGAEKETKKEKKGEEICMEKSSSPADIS
jgi:hypothetical protein